MDKEKDEQTIKDINKNANEPTSKKPEWDKDGNPKPKKRRKESKREKRTGCGNVGKSDTTADEIHLTSLACCPDCGNKMAEKEGRADSGRIVEDIPPPANKTTVFKEVTESKWCDQCKKMVYSTSENLIRHVSLRQLQIFEAVVRIGGYTRAAQTLHLTQPTVSMQIKKLSEALGLPLLEQVGRQAHPTAAGRDVYTAAKEILDKMVALGESTSELEGVVKGELRIAVITTAKYFMPHLLGAFVAQYPLVKPRLAVTNRTKALTRLKANEDDLLIMGRVPGEVAVQAYPFIDNELVVVASPDHSLSGARNITLKQLSQERFLSREPESGTRKAVEQLFADHGLKVEPYMELGSIEAIKQGVMAGLGLSVLSRHNLRLELSSNHIVILDVDGFPLIRRWHAVHLQGKKLSLVARTFLDFILNESSEVLSA